LLLASHLLLLVQGLVQALRVLSQPPRQLVHLLHRLCQAAWPAEVQLQGLQQLRAAGLQLTALPVGAPPLPPWPAAGLPTPCPWGSLQQVTAMLLSWLG
jgi:hypothetical protein